MASGDQTGRPVEDLPEVLTAAEVADWLGFSRQTVLKHLRAGVIPGRQIGREWRVHRSALVKFLAEGDGAESDRQDEEP